MAVCGIIELSTSAWTRKPGKIAQAPSAICDICEILTRVEEADQEPEGFHKKMETISRQAYGFRNFENYRQAL